MNEEAHAGLLLALGALALRLSLTDAHLAYVKAGIRPALVVAGVVLVVLGALVLLRRRGPAQNSDTTLAYQPAHGHGGHAPRVGWLLAAPVLVIGLIAPDPLGAYAANRQSARIPPPPNAAFPPLPAARDGAVDLRLSEFTVRAAYDEARSLEGVPVRLVGFASGSPDAGQFYLTRFIVTCCAADARAVRVRVHGAPTPPPASDTWLELVGTWRPDGRQPEDDRPVEFDARQVTPIPAPASPYET